MDAVRVEVDDLIQQSYVYLLTDPIGRTAPSLSGLATKLKTCAASAQIGRAVRNGSSLQQKEGATGVEATATGLSDPFRHPERNIELTTTLNLKVTFSFSVG